MRCWQPSCTCSCWLPGAAASELRCAHNSSSLLQRPVSRTSRTAAHAISFAPVSGVTFAAAGICVAASLTEMASRPCLRQVALQLHRQGRAAVGLGCQQQGIAPRCLSSASAQAAAGTEPAPSRGRILIGRALALLLPSSIAGVLAWGYSHPDEERFGTAATPHCVAASGETVVNWSATHSVQPRRYYQPETQADVEAIVADCAAAKRRLRVVGSGLSPNGIGFSGEGMMSMALLDRVLWVDADAMQVRVEAGCRVQQVADVLKSHGMSLANYASIREQQIGGFTQVSAHGTGAAIPPVDEQVVALKLVTPGRGVLELSADKDPELFALARCGLGCLGVVTELTLQAVPAQRLRERTFVASAREVARQHARWLGSHKHMRYMWLPFTDSVVVVQVDPHGPPETPRAAADGGGAAAAAAKPPGAGASGYGDVEQAPGVDDATLAHRLQPLRQLLLEAARGVSAADIEALSATQLRDALLVLNPLDSAWVARVNQAEATFWQRSAGTRYGYADEILGFDCGGQQWVLEVAFPVGPHSSVTSAWRSRNTDLAYMQQLLADIEAAGIPAHAPIEQRWTASSSSPMSPASAPPAGAGRRGGAAVGSSDTVHSWVGIIMYLPSDDPEQRDAITERFRQYAGLVQDKLMPRYGATWHWAKIEAPDDPARLQAMRDALAARFPLERFNAYRAQLDPHNILGNELLDTLLGKPGSSGNSSSG